MSNKPEFVTSIRLPKGSVWKVKDELVGGTRLEGLTEALGGLPRVRMSPEAFQALKQIRRRGETVQEAVERVIFEAATRSA
jgi:hypothetical protein